MNNKHNPNPWEGEATKAVFAETHLHREMQERLVHWFAYLADEAWAGHLQMPPGEKGERCSSCPVGDDMIVRQGSFPYMNVAWVPAKEDT